MHPSAYMQAFHTRGVILWREGERLRYRAPDGVLTPAILANLAVAKAVILPLLPEAPPAVSAIADTLPMGNTTPAGIITEPFPDAIEAELQAAGHEADLEHELLLAHYEKRLPKQVKPLITCPSGRHICNLAVAVAGMLQRHRGEQEGVHIGPKLAQADAADWEFLLEWWQAHAPDLNATHEATEPMSQDRKAEFSVSYTHARARKGTQS